MQGLTAALYALELDDTDAVRDYVRRTLDSAREIITDLVGPVEGPIAPGDLVRSSPSTLDSRTTVWVSPASAGLKGRPSSGG